MAGTARARPALRVVEGSLSEAPALEPPPAPTLDDVEILEACRRGDPSAAFAIHARVRPLVDATVGRLLGRKDSRFEDIAQIAMIELVRSLSRFRGECSLDTWTSRVTARAVYKEIRRRNVEARVLTSVGEDIEVESGPDELGNLEARSTLRRVRVHLAALDPTKAWTLVLHDVCGYDLKEIAEITEATVAAAQSRLVRGRAELSARIEADPELAELLERRGRR